MQLSSVWETLCILVKVYYVYILTCVCGQMDAQVECDLSVWEPNPRVVAKYM